MNPGVERFNAAREPEDRIICEILAADIDGCLPEAESKIWHGHPVWFLDGNPIAGYSKLKDCIRLLFWSGQSFSGVANRSTSQGWCLRAASRRQRWRYTSPEQIDADALDRWLDKSKRIQWDYKNIVKRKGRLERLV